MKVFAPSVQLLQLKSLFGFPNTSLSFQSNSLMERANFELKFSHFKAICCRGASGYFEGFASFFIEFESAIYATHFDSFNDK